MIRETVTLRTLAGRVNALAREKERKVKAGLRKAAREGASYVREHTVPVAFGELKKSVHAEDSNVVADAPHAHAAEFGARPHRVPLAPLVAWVKLRGMQGLGRGKASTRPSAVSTRRALDSLVGANNATPVDAAVQVARAIQAKILKVGTEPTFFLSRAIPYVHALARTYARRALRDDS